MMRSKTCTGSGCQRQDAHLQRPLLHERAPANCASGWHESGQLLGRCFIAWLAQHALSMQSLQTRQQSCISGALATAAISALSPAPVLKETGAGSVAWLEWAQGFVLDVTCLGVLACS